MTTTTSNKSKSAKSAKSAAKPTQLATAIADQVESFNAAVVQHNERVAQLSAIDVSALNAQESKDHRAAMLAAVNRGQRAARFASLLADASIADAFMRFDLTARACMGLQIYAQDKMLDSLRALGLNLPLSACAAKKGYANRTTQAVIETLIKHGERTHHEIIGDMETITGKALSTCSAQASSSRQLLETLGMLTFNPVKRSYALNDRGIAAAGILGA